MPQDEPEGHLTFRYHQPFLPEYVTTIAISLAVNWMVLASSRPGQLPAGDNPHVYGALAAYTAVILTLLGLTVYHRYRFSTVTLTDSGTERRFLGFNFSQVAFDEIDSVEERRGGFFGRSARLLVLRTRAMEETVIADFVHGYDRLREELLARWPGTPTNKEPLSEREFAQLKEAARLRDLVFGLPGLHNVKKRVPFRVMGLLPVVGVEALGAALVIYEVFGEGPQGGPNPLSVYAGAVTLALSGLAARFTYYYIFSTHWAEQQ